MIVLSDTTDQNEFAWGWIDMWLGIGKRIFLYTNVKQLHKLQVGIPGFQFPEFWKASQVDELYPDRFDWELHMKVATVSKGNSPFTWAVL